MKKKPNPKSYETSRTRNIIKHLGDTHCIADPSKPALIITNSSPSIVELLRLDPMDKKEQLLANELKRQFNPLYFQRLLVEWIVHDNLSFWTIESPRLRAIFEYLNPAVETTQANLSHDTIRKRIVSLFQDHKETVREMLQASPGQIHISFDGWTSRNHHAMYGIVAHFLDEDYQPQKVVLSMPKLATRHTGQNIAAQITEILKEFNLAEKIGYFNIDNASNNDTAMVALAMTFGFNATKRRLRCFGHIINLVVRAMLFGTDDQVLNDDEDDDIDELRAKHEEWVKKGPIRKLHNLVRWIHRSEHLTKALCRLQTDLDEEANASKPLDVILNNDTRWLSQYHMMQRALRLR